MEVVGENFAFKVDRMADGEGKVFGRIGILVI